MKIRLRIAAAGRTTTFEHAGPVVRIGRDPECELAFEGDASTGVSRQHARVELSPEGATLADAGSSNGTLLNGRLLHQEGQLQHGDQLQIGPVLFEVLLIAAPAEAGTTQISTTVGTDSSSVITDESPGGLEQTRDRPIAPGE